MKSTTLLLCLCIIAGCSSTASQETVSQDTLKTAESVSASLAEEAPEPVFTMSDTAAILLKSNVDAQFETVYQALADSASYYKVAYFDYFDEYEGQAEMKINTWYFDKDFTVVYGTYSYENGAMNKPDVTEYITKNDLVTAVKMDSEYDAQMDHRAYTRWSTETDGVTLNWTHYFERADTILPLPKDFAKEAKNDWDSYLSTLQDMLDEEEGMSEDGNIYTILIETPKQSELVDYRKLIIPKEVYERLRAE